MGVSILAFGNRGRFCVAVLGDPDNLLEAHVVIEDFKTTTPPTPALIARLQDSGRVRCPMHPLHHPVECEID